ncbi:unnamed protein product [Diatraea saccharalis]|uniref:PHD-type domain-containing protein n=1 Tax=Diatraea saccharalis TaxID=40085 RepID=A0A9N9R6J6_9NEOP|nr:unnamed protein product [Diatraea saccharalis]
MCSILSRKASSFFELIFRNLHSQTLTDLNYYIRLKMENTKKERQIVVCEKCKNRKDVKDTILCSRCKRNYDFDCMGLSEKLYRLMEPKKRLTWKCTSCSMINNKHKGPIPNKLPMQKETDKNITLRKKTATKPTVSPSPITKSMVTSSAQSSPLFGSCSIDDEETYEDTSTETMSKSVDYSAIKICDIQDMKDEIYELKTNLLSTQTELENTIIENNEFKREINKLNKEIETLKNICRTPIAKKKGGTSGIKSAHTFTPLTGQMPRRISCSIINTNDSGENDCDLIIRLQKKIDESERNLKKAKDDVIKLEIQIKQLEKNLAQEDKKHTKYPETSMNTIEIDKHQSIKKNIFIVGTQQCAGLAVELKKTRYNKIHEDYQISAFIKPFAPTEEILKTCTNLETNINDKVIICVGENDSDSIVSISELYNVLKSLQRTTIIVMSILDSKHLNTKLYNKQLQIIYKKFKNCHYLSTEYCYYNHPLRNICYKINQLIDYMHYEKTFLNYSFIREHIRSSNCKQKKNHC